MVSENSDVEISHDVPVSSLTTLGVGGRCHGYVEIRSLAEFKRVYLQAQASGTQILVIGEGSNLLFSDSGFAGLVIRNRIQLKIRSGVEVEVGGGENLLEVIHWLNHLGLAGMQKMYGIPGTVAGALVGNAGAYGQEIGDVVVRVDAWKAGELISFSKDSLQLQYRSSFFKHHPGWFIVNCRLRLHKSHSNLQSLSEEILAQRLVKYPPGLKCPGSFFRNVVISEISEDIKQSLPETFIYGDRIPAGKLLEAVGACGVRRGDAQFADYHGNLIINRGEAKSEDILSLANEFAGRVFEHFQIRLEPEILIVDDSGEWPYLKSMIQV
jgi:UDP-N-acetylmuramate dehydrogenase